MDPPLPMSQFTHTEKLRGITTTYTAPTVDALARAVTDGRRKIGLRADYNAVHNEMRRKTGRLAKTSQPKIHMTPKDVLAGAKAVIKNFAGQIVPQTEIDRRAAICSKCPLVSPMAGCSSGCGLSRQAVEAFNTASSALFGKVRYDIPPKLKKTYCGACGCSFAAILPAQIEDFLPDTPEKAAKRPSNCWLKMENR